MNIPVHESSTEDLILSGGSFIKKRKRIGPKTDPWDTPGNAGIGS